VTKLRLVPYSDLKKVLAAKGFHWLRCEGSHNVFRHESGRIVVLPDHGSRVIVRYIKIKKSCVLSNNKNF
jgi:predicted RNA binding protein YcfA (HicA-like mRNA interferase family)